MGTDNTRVSGGHSRKHLPKLESSPVQPWLPSPTMSPTLWIPHCALPPWGPAAGLGVEHSLQSAAHTPDADKDSQCLW